MPPLKGVFHAAMTLDDDLLGRLDQDRFRAVLAPKVAGGWNLHELTRIDELDHLEGIESIGADDAYAALEHVLRHDTSRVAIARIDWNRWMDGTSPRHVANTGRERQASSNAPADRGARNLLAELLGAEAAARAALVERRLVQCAASGLDADPARVEPERSLTDMGLDSLMAVELQNAVRRDLGVAMTSPCRTPAADQYVPFQLETFAPFLQHQRHSIGSHGYRIWRAGYLHLSLRRPSSFVVIGSVRAASAESLLPNV